MSEQNNKVVVKFNCQTPKQNYKKINDKSKFFLLYLSLFKFYIF